MINIDVILNIIFPIVYFIALILDIKRDLHIMQLNSYRPERYMRWAKQKYFTGIKSLIVILVLPLLASLLFPKNIILVLIIIFWSFYSIKLLKQKSKKPLVFTARAKRIYTLAIVLLCVQFYISWNFAVSEKTLVWVFSIAQIFSGLFVVVSVFLLTPIEKLINKSYYNDAKRLLKSHSKLKIIGITGSYGKTSVKHFLHAILSEKYNVLMTPGSYNTTMGVIRTVREYLKPVHEVFIAEMGAKQKGDIKEICDLVEPEVGILTAVAPQHLETFKTIENVKKTKFELIDSLPENGLAVLNADYETIKSNVLSNGIQKNYYSVKFDSVDFHAKNIYYTSKGMKFHIFHKNQLILELETKLLGEHNVSNIVASCVVALHLGVDKESIKFAVKKLKPVQHRLEIKPNLGGITVIDDAFNANPDGARMAVEVLKQVSGNQKIIITPGMIELGSKEEELNFEFGKQIAQNCDYAILVGKKQTKPIFEGLKEAGFATEKVYVAQSIYDANNHMRSIATTGDVVLYENDLPDTFNE